MTLTRKFSRPKTDADEVQELEWGLCVTERDLSTSKVGAENLPYRFLPSLKIKKSRGNGIHERELLKQRRTQELEGLNVDLRGRKKGTYGCRVAAEDCRVTLVKPG